MKPLLTPVEQTILCDLITTLAPKSVLEIGTGFGGSAYLIHERLPHDGYLVSLDPEPQPEALAQFEQMRRAELVIGSSPGDIPKRHYDFIFVDGDHSSAAVWLDAKAAYDWLLTDGHMLFHDASHPNVRRGLRKVEQHLGWQRPGERLCGGFIDEHGVTWGGLHLLQKR